MKNNEFKVKMYGGISYGYSKPFEKIVELLLNHYINDDFLNPSRQVRFIITENCLKDYLQETEDNRTIEEFLNTYDSDESDIFYGYAADDGRILSEEVTYCDDFEEKYLNFIKTAKQITKEKYYWTVYVQNSL